MACSDPVLANSLRKLRACAQEKTNTELQKTATGTPSRMASIILSLVDYEAVCVSEQRISAEDSLVNICSFCKENAGLRLTSSDRALNELYAYIMSMKGIISSDEKYKCFSHYIVRVVRCFGEPDSCCSFGKLAKRCKNMCFGIPAHISFPKSTKPLLMLTNVERRLKRKIATGCLSSVQTSTLWIAIGEVRYISGRRSSSLQCFRRAQRFVSSAQAVTGKQRNELLFDSHSHIAAVLLSLGNYYKTLVEFEFARTYINGSVKPIQFVLCLCCMGHALLSLGAYGAAVKYYRYALEVDRHVTLPVAFRGMILTALGTSYRLSGDAHLCITSCYQALFCLELSVGLNHPYVANVLEEVGNVFIEDMNLESALSCFHRAWQIRSDYSSKAVGSLLTNLAILFIKRVTIMSAGSETIIHALEFAAQSFFGRDESSITFCLSQLPSLKVLCKALVQSYILCRRERPTTKNSAEPSVDRIKTAARIGNTAVDTCARVLLPFAKHVHECVFSNDFEDDYHLPSVNDLRNVVRDMQLNVTDLFVWSLEAEKQRSLFTFNSVEGLMWSFLWYMWTLSKAAVEIMLVFTRCRFGHRHVFEIEGRLEHGDILDRLPERADKYKRIYQCVKVPEKTLEAALSEYESASDMSSRLLGNAHPLAILALSKVSNLYKEQKKKVEALQKKKDCVLEALKLRRPDLPCYFYQIFQVKSAIEIVNAKDEHWVNFWTERCYTIWVLSGYGRRCSFQIQQMLDSAGDLLNKCNDYKGAIRMYRRSLEICRTRGDWKPTASTLRKIGSMYNYQRKYEDATHLFALSLSIISICNDGDIDISYVDALNGLGNSLLFSGAVSDAVSVHTQALESAISIQCISRVGRFRNNLGNAYQKMSYNAEASRCYWIAKLECPPTGQEYARRCINVGDISMKLEEYQRAIEAYKTAIFAISNDIDSPQYNRAVLNFAVVANFLCQSGHRSSYTAELEEAQKWLQERLRRDKSVLERKSNTLQEHDVVGYVRLLFVACKAQCVLHPSKATDAVRHLAKWATKYSDRFPLRARQVLKHAIILCDCFPVADEIKFEMYAKLANIALKQRTIYEALSYVLDSVEDDETALQHPSLSEVTKLIKSRNVSHQTFAPLESCESLVNTLYDSALNDIDKELGVSHKTANLSSLAFVKLRSVLDQAYVQLVHSRTGSMKEKYFPIKPNEHDLRRQLRKDGVLKDAWRGNSAIRLEFCGDTIKTLGIKRMIQEKKLVTKIRTATNESVNVLKTDDVTRFLETSTTPDMNDTLSEEESRFALFYYMLQRLNDEYTHTTNDQQDLYKKKLNCLIPSTAEVLASLRSRNCIQLAEGETSDVGSVVDHYYNIVCEFSHNVNSDALVTCGAVDSICPCFSKAWSCIEKRIVSNGTCENEQKALCKILKPEIAKQWMELVALEKNRKGIDIFETISREQPYSYRDMSESWLEKVASIANSTKHIRLVPHQAEKKVIRKKGSIGEQVVSITVEYTEERFHRGSFVEQLSHALLLSWEESLRLSERIVLGLQKYNVINEREVCLPACRCIIDCLRNYADAIPHYGVQSLAEEVENVLHHIALPTDLERSMVAAVIVRSLINRLICSNSLCLQNSAKLAERMSLAFARVGITLNPECPEYNTDEFSHLAEKAQLHTIKDVVLADENIGEYFRPPEHQKEIILPSVTRKVKMFLLGHKPEDLQELNWTDQTIDLHFLLSVSVQKVRPIVEMFSQSQSRNTEYGFPGTFQHISASEEPHSVDRYIRPVDHCLASLPLPLPALNQLHDSLLREVKFLKRKQGLQHALNRLLEVAENVQGHHDWYALHLYRFAYKRAEFLHTHDAKLARSYFRFLLKLGLLDEIPAYLSQSTTIERSEIWGYPSSIIRKWRSEKQKYIDSDLFGPWEFVKEQIYDLEWLTFRYYRTGVNELKVEMHNRVAETVTKLKHTLDQSWSRLLISTMNFPDEGTPFMHAPCLVRDEDGNILEERRAVEKMRRAVEKVRKALGKKLRRKTNVHSSVLYSDRFSTILQCKRHEILQGWPSQLATLSNVMKHEGININKGNDCSGNSYTGHLEEWFKMTCEGKEISPISLLRESIDGVKRLMTIFSEYRVL